MRYLICMEFGKCKAWSLVFMIFIITAQKKMVL